MIGQITPLVQVASKRIWIEAVSLHALGSILSAAALGAVLGTLGWTLQLQRWWLGGVIGMLFLLAAVHEAGVIPVPVPTTRRQTPKWVIDVFGSTWGSFVWGLDLGQGWTTQVVSVGYYALLPAVVLLAQPLYGALTFACYGLARALPLVAAGARAARDQRGWSPPAHQFGEVASRWLSIAALSFAAGLLLAG